jgi:hypothetical protein
VPLRYESAEDSWAYVVVSHLRDEHNERLLLTVLETVSFVSLDCGVLLEFLA